jgi:hypothetical protein
MTYTAHNSTIRSIRQDELGFYIHDGVTVAARAGIEFSPECSDYLASIIRSAFSKGHIKLVAHVKDNELMWETLSK